MGKYLRAAMLNIAVIILFIAMYAFSGKVSAKPHIQFSYNVEQAQGKAPLVKAYINGRNLTEKSSIKAKVSGADFDRAMDFGLENMEKFSSSGEGIHYIILFDNSMSVDKKQFGQAKEELVKLRKKMSGKDIMDLYTVGSNSPSGKKKHITQGKSKTSEKEQIKAIRAIKRDKTKTVLYRSLSEVLATADNDDIRTVVLIITDGEDDSQGKNNKSYQVNPVVKSSKIPVYGVLLKNIVKNPDKAKTRNTKKNILNEKISHGYYEECVQVKDVVKGFKNIREILYDGTYVATLRQENLSNRTTTDASLVLICDNEETGLSNGRFTYNNIGEADTKPPVISNIKKTGGNSIQFTIRDDKTKYINGAGEAANYTVKDSSGKDWKIDKVNANPESGTYELIFSDKLYTGEYTIRCSNITDDSQEKNSITETASFSFEGLDRKIENIKDIVNVYWWVLLIAVVIITGIVLIIILKHRPVKTEKIIVEQSDEAGVRLLGITVTDNNGITSEVEWNVEGSIFIGRSDICDVCFNDEMLSKQHFVIEVTGKGCYIEDLDTTNGTFVNGVKMSGKRRISDGDIVMAGCEKFVFHTLDSEVK